MKRNEQFAENVRVTMRAFEAQYGLKKHAPVLFCHYEDFVIQNPFNFKFQNIFPHSRSLRMNFPKREYHFMNDEILRDETDRLRSGLQYENLVRIFAAFSILYSESCGKCLISDIIPFINGNCEEMTEPLNCSFLGHLDFKNEKECQAGYLILLSFLKHQHCQNPVLDISEDETKERATRLVESVDDGYWNSMNICHYGNRKYVPQLVDLALSTGFVFEWSNRPLACTDLNRQVAEKLHGLVWFLENAQDDGIYDPEDPDLGFKIGSSRSFFEGAAIFGIDLNLLADLVCGKTKETIVDNILPYLEDMTQASESTKAHIKKAWDLRHDVFEEKGNLQEEVAAVSNAKIKEAKRERDAGNLDATSVWDYFGESISKALLEDNPDKKEKLLFWSFVNELLEIVDASIDGTEESVEEALEFLTIVFGGYCFRPCSMIPWIETMVPILFIENELGKAKTVKFFNFLSDFRLNRRDGRKMDVAEIIETAKAISQDESCTFEWAFYVASD